VACKPLVPSSETYREIADSQSRPADEDKDSLVFQQPLKGLLPKGTLFRWGLWVRRVQVWASKVGGGPNEFNRIFTFWMAAINQS